MADSEEMRRLILHSAERLQQETKAHVSTGSSWLSTIAAMALAESTLRMVAACMGVEEQPRPSVAAEPTPSPEPPADGPRRTRRMGGNS